MTNPFRLKSTALHDNWISKVSYQSLHAIIVIASITLSSCAATHEIAIEKIDGVALESPSKQFPSNVLNEIKGIGAEYVCLMPYAYMESGIPEVRYDSEDWQWWGEKSEGIIGLCHDAKAENLSVMIKPHLWIGHGEYTGELRFSDSDAQSKWNSSYRDYILNYARIAEQHDVAILCIGTELCGQLTDAPEFWKALIIDIRKEFSGALTYASNWDCYQDFPLWADLDFIGIDAYFPISESDTPSLVEAKKGWLYWKSEMSALSDSIGKPILFTEYGYRSYSDALKRPWESGPNTDANYEIQTLGYQALYEEVWPEPWFAGGFLWKWHCKEHVEQGVRSDKFTPQEKPALDPIKKQYNSQYLRKEE